MAKPIRMEYFTDPYCAWSWALQPTLEELIAIEGDRLEVRYRQLPLIEDRDRSGQTGEDVAGKWEQIARLTGVRLDARLWREQPPRSTVPANRASKAAGTLGPEAEGRFLHALRPMLMTLGRSADDPETLALAAAKAELDVEAFKRALAAPDLEAQLAEDRRLARELGLRHTPAVVLTNQQDDKIVIEGPRDFELFRRAVEVLRVEEDTALLAEGKLSATPFMPESSPARQPGS